MSTTVQTIVRVVPKALQPSAMLRAVEGHNRGVRVDRQIDGSMGGRIDGQTDG